MLSLILCLFILTVQVTSFAAETNGEHMYTNRLINEKSLYLLQHAHNPVNWFPWGDEAFEIAKKEQKVVFLSIGYSTCHWCHIMEEESFSNPEIAEILNANFISIKVDREERPDIDHIYMNAVQIMTGSGGWPLTVFLTPDKKPFYGGTYFPPEDKWGRPGLKTLLNSISDSWKTQKKEILRSGEALVNAISQRVETTVGNFSLSEDTLKMAYEQFSSSFDSRYGGFNPPPKFPRGHSVSFLLRYWKRTGETQAIKIAEKTLTEMAKGGVYDHIGGGFHRYSTDSQWRVPHFEKMLYDQAIIAKTYLEAYQATGKKEYGRAAGEIFEYVLRDMMSPEGAFYSAEDADSLSRGESDAKRSEGAFYIWHEEEIRKVLDRETADVFSYYFGVKSEGNALQDAHGEFIEKNILYVAKDLEETATHFKKSIAEVKRKIADSKKKLFIERSKRPRPHLDDKILVDWNGLMISSLAFGSRVLEEPRYADAAERSAQFILKNLVRKDGRLLHRYRDGESAILGTIEDYAFFIHGLFDLYEATFKAEYLAEAKQLCKEMLRLFWDKEGGGFFFTSDDAEKLFVRQKEIYDGALPSGNSIAALDLIRLGRLTATEEFETKLDSLFRAFSDQISVSPQAYPQMLIALDFALGPSKEIIISGDLDSVEAKAMISSIYSRFIPNKVVASRPVEELKAETIIHLVPFLEKQLALDGKATAYVCENYTCNFPTTSLEEMQKLLEDQEK